MIRVFELFEIDGVRAGRGGSLAAIPARVSSGYAGPGEVSR